MELPGSFREALVEVLDQFLEAYSRAPDPEAVSEFLVEQLELFADETGLDDIVAGLEESGELDDTLIASLEEEMSSNDEFEYTGEEIVQPVRAHVRRSSGATRSRTKRTTSTTTTTIDD